MLSSINATNCKISPARTFPFAPPEPISKTFLSPSPVIAPANWPKPPKEPAMTGDTLLRTFSIARKEMLHIVRDPQTLFFTIFVPVMELFMLGYAIDTNVRNVRTVVADHAGTQE